MFNPYEFMLQLRNNKVLFQYLENAAVIFDSDKEWVINGESIFGHTEVYRTKGECLRIVLPIAVPSFMQPDVLQHIVNSLQGNLNGIISPVIDEEKMYIEYYIHVPLVNFKAALDRILIEFLKDRADITKGFEDLEKEFNKMKSFMETMKDSKEMTDDSSFGKSSEGGSSFWDDVEDIDKKNIDDDSDADEPES